MSLSTMDQLRIERAVMTIDLYTQDLPGRIRKTIRRDLRANLTSAAQEVGGKQAVRNLGNLRRVAADYLDAEYGTTGPRPRWIQGLLWVIATGLIINVATTASAIGFFEGVLQAAPMDKAATYSWHPFTSLGPRVEVEILPDNGGWGWFMSLPPWPFFIFLAVFLIGARWWRVLRAGRGRRVNVPAGPTPDN